MFQVMQEITAMSQSQIPPPKFHTRHDKTAPVLSSARELEVGDFNAIIVVSRSLMPSRESPAGFYTYLPHLRRTCNK